SACATRSGIPISSGQRQSTVALVRLDEQCLVDIEAAGMESIGRSSKKESPGTVNYLIRDTEYLIGMRFQTTHPVPQRERVMLAQALHITDLEAGLLRNAECCADRHELQAGENVAIGEGRSVVYRLGSGVRDAVVQENAAWTQ